MQQRGHAGTGDEKEIDKCVTRYEGYGLGEEEDSVETEAADGVEGDSFSASGQSRFHPPDRPTSM